MPYDHPEEALVARLKADVAVAALVSGRVWPEITVQNPDFPFVLYENTGGDELQTLAGSTGLGKYTFELTVFAKTAAGARDLGQKVRAAVHDWRDVANGVQGCFADLHSVDVEDYGRTWQVTAGLWFQRAV